MVYRPEFLYPTSRQFPFDEVCEKIVRALEARNFSVKGITVEFDVYGSGEEKYRLVRKVEGKNFRLYFCRVQRTMPGGHWNDTAAVTKLNIPKKELHVYEDESGPTLYLYVGTNWASDHERFEQGLKVNSRLNNEPRMYLMYKGSWGTVYSYSGSRPPLLVHDTDLGREYSAKVTEPKQFRTSEVLEEFKAWLEKHVLAYILSFSEATEKLDLFKDPDPIPFPASVGSLFTYGDYDDMRNIEQGKRDPQKLDASKRMVYPGNSLRFVPYAVSNDGTIPEIAYEGFIWCGVGNVTVDSLQEAPEVPGWSRWDNKVLLRVKPNRANDVYIADMGGQDEYKEGIWEANPEQKRLTDEQYYEFKRIPGRTFVPITEYRGGFKQPVVLINRELGFDEVEIVGELPRRH
jgi:hypothetical protein